MLEVQKEEKPEIELMRVESKPLVVIRSPCHLKHT